jgi:universal stress protein F
MYKNILVPVDLEHKDQAAAMISAARSMAEDGAKLTLVFVMPEMPAVVGLYLPQSTIQKAKSDAEEQLVALAKADSAPDTISIATVFGRPHHEILEMAKAKNVDLIVIASHKPGISDYLLGSVAAGVVRHAKCSVHVMR